MLSFLDLDQEPLDIIDYLIFSFFFLISFLIIFPWLKPGFILARDMIFVPVWPVPPVSNSSFLTGSIFHIIGLFIPTMFMQKIILFSIFFFSMIGMYRLVSVKSTLARIFAALLYIFNPFVYERLVDGQWMLLVGYMLTPFIFRQTLIFFKHPSFSQALRLSILLTLLGNFSTHLLFVTAFFLSVYIILNLIFNRMEPGIYSCIIFLAATFFILNANWLLPFALGKSEEAVTVSSATADDLSIFQSVPDSRFGLLFNLLSGYGYWGERNGEFISPKNLFLIWPIVSLVFIGLFLYGIFTHKEKDERSFDVSLIILFVAGLLLSAGVASPYIRDIIFELYKRIPLLKGLREPQKLVAFIMLSYAFFGSFAVDKIIRKNIKFIFLFLLLPVLYTPTLFFGAWGQLKSVNYPASWESVNKLLVQDNDNFLVLSLPWHQYMRYSFNNNKVIANPMPQYFHKPILASQNYETKALYSHDERPEALHVEGLLKISKEGVNLFGGKVDQIQNWGEALAPINVKYVILAKDDDWKTYNFLDKSPDLKKIYDAPEIALYLNESWERRE